MNDLAGVLYLCATPIGNLEDITLRALRILKETDLIAAEDTRHTRKLLTHYGISTPSTSYHEHNKVSKGLKLIAALKEGKNVALVSDAGTPGISDPGQELVALAVREGIKVVPVPGPAAVIAAVTISGLPTDGFVFEGFLPRAKKERNRVLGRLAEEERTIVFYESPLRVVKTLQEILSLVGDREAAVTRELTKAFEQTVRGQLSAIIKHFQSSPPKGEFTVVLAGRPKDRKSAPAASLEEAVGLVRQLAGEGLSKKASIKEAANRLGYSRKDVYEAVLRAEDKK